MDFEREVQKVAAQYQSEGYNVVQPQGEQLPAFAAGFRVDILASKGDERVLVRVVPDRTELEANPEVPQQAEITNSQPKWSYDLVVLHRDDPMRRMLRDAEEPSPEQIEQMLVEAERLNQFGIMRAAFVLSWAGLEATMRRVAQQVGRGDERGASARTLLQGLYAWGYLSREELSRLEEMSKVLISLVHGYVPCSLEAGMVPAAVAISRRLQSETAPPHAAAS